jgi:hypothetical protein
MGGMDALFAESGGLDAMAGAIAIFFCASVLCVVAGVLFVAAGMNQERRDTAGGKLLSVLHCQCLA